MTLPRARAVPTTVLRSRLVGVIVIGLFALAGCSGSDGPPSLEQIAEDARSRGQDWQGDVLDDGDVTLAEYDEAHRRTLACLDEAGLTYSEPERNIPNGYEWLYDIFWAGMSDADGRRAADICQAQIRYVALAMSAWGDWETEPELLAFVVRCVKREGFAVPDDVKNYRDVWLSGADDGLTRETVSSCVDAGMMELHPGADWATGF